MFFDKISEIERIAAKCGTAVFVVPKGMEVEIENAIVLKPEDKSVITIEQVRIVMGRLSMKQTREQYVVVRPADLLNDEAANALLKNLEEPREKVHFVLVTEKPSELLPTILSRAAVYFLRVRDDGGIVADEKTKALAKRLMVAKGADLVAVAEEITKKKDGVRARALEVVGVTIEMLYKTYFITGKEVFVEKIPKFLTVYENISRNGHVKLHLVADLC